MCEKDLISIIVPIYNQEKYLCECVESLIVQSYKNIEIILVDDGSTDHSGMICDNYSKKDKRIKVIHQKNGGLSCARNIGIEYCRGKYIVFVDSDDYVEKKYISSLYFALKENDVQIAMCNYTEFNFNNVIRNECENYLKEVHTTNDLLTVLWKSSETYVACVVVWNKIFDRNIFDNIKFKEPIHEDEFLFNKLITMNLSVKFIDESLYNYRQRENSLIHKPISKDNLLFLDCLNERINILEEKKLISILNKARMVFLDKYIEYYFELKKQDRIVLKNKYYLFFKKFIKELKNILTHKNYIRFSLFLISPQVYNVVVMMKNKFRKEKI